MNKIFCVDVGIGTVFRVDVDLSTTVDDLKRKLKEDSHSVSFDATLLKLYLAKRGGSWLSVTNIDVEALRRGEIPEVIRALMHDETVGTRRLDDPIYFGENFERSDGDVHVLVAFPKDPYNERWIFCRLAGQYLFLVAVVIAIAAALSRSCSVSCEWRTSVHCDGVEIWVYAGLAAAFLFLAFVRAVLTVKLRHAYRRWGYAPGYEPIP